MTTMATSATARRTTARSSRAFGPHGLVPGFEPTTVGAPALAGATITLPVDDAVGPDVPAARGHVGSR